VRQRTAGLAADMQRELKRHLLVRPDAIKQRDGRAERLEVEKEEGIGQGIEEAAHLRLVHERRSQFDRGRVNGLARGASHLSCDAALRPAHGNQWAVIGFGAVPADWNVGR